MSIGIFYTGRGLQVACYRLLARCLLAGCAGRSLGVDLVRLQVACYRVLAAQAVAFGEGLLLVARS